MAKKKKNRKTRSKKRQLQKNISIVPDSKKDNTMQSEPADTSASIKNNSDIEKNYVKDDVIRSLILIGIVIASYIVLFVVLEKTSLGLKIYSIIKL